MRAAGEELAGERKPVTILFTDIVGSTAIAEKLDPETWREIVAGAHRLIAEAVYRYEGTIAQLLGDGVLAFFGAPITHEDDPARACLAGLEILDSIKEYRKELGRRVENFQVRVGIHTGEVVIGDIGTDLHVEYLAFGDAVNTAARLEEAAEPETILIGESTNKLVAHAFEIETLGTIKVKGKKEPIEVFRLLAAKAQSRKLRGIEGLESELVGREDESAALLQVLERLKNGEGGIVTIVGEAGIGKSRLVAEFHKQVVDSAVEWMEGRCLSYGGSIPYLLWLDIFQTAFGMREESDPSQMLIRMKEKLQAICGERSKDVYPYLGDLLSLPLDDVEATRLEEMDGGELKSRIFRAVATVLECAAETQPVVLVCEDLHWADPSSLELIQAVLPLGGKVPLTVICVQRPDKDHGSWHLRETISREFPQRFTDLELTRLSKQDSEVLVNNLVGLDGLPEKLRDRIHRRAEGNPFYLEEILRSLVDAGFLALEKATGRWTVVGEMERIKIPDTLHGVLLARIDRLQEDTKRVLQMASVIGRIFLYRILSAISKKERDLDAHLESLMLEEMIRERARLPELEYIFKHHLTQEAAYGALLKKERRRYHKQVAQSLERLFPERIEELLGVLAHHWERVGDADKAVEYLHRAGDQARLAYAHQEAVDFYQRALTILKEEDEFDRAGQTLMKLGLTHHTAFDFKASRQAYQEAFRLRQERDRIRPVAPPAASRPLHLCWGESLSYDPTSIPNYGTFLYIRNIFSGLVEQGRGGEILPDVARSWEISEDGRKYVFHLRDDVLWSDGQKVTAGDFEFTFLRLLDPGAESFVKRELFDVKNARAYHQGEITDAGDVGIRALDPATFEIELTQPASYFLYILANMFPVPKHLVEDLGKSWVDLDRIVTNGPFHLRSIQSADAILLAKNPSYHGRFPGNLQQVHIKQISHQMPPGEYSELIDELYQTASIDAMIVPEEKYGLCHQLAEDHHSEPVPGLYFFVLDNSCPPFDDARVRRAFALALDKTKIAKEIPGGFRFPATGGFVPPGIPGHSTGIGLPFDPDQAQKLLAEAGFPRGKGFPELEVVWDVEGKILRNILSQWKDHLNVEVRLRLVEAREVFREARRSKLYYIGWRASYLDPDNFLRVCIREALPQMNEEAYDRLLEKANVTLDQSERIQLYQAADKLLMEHAAIIPIDYFQAHFLVKPWMKIPAGRIQEWCLKDVILEPQ
jgi:ABC-type oligopeptide transport system substrate-binding subunit/class 3 adenylate cyclase